MGLSKAALSRGTGVWCARAAAGPCSAHYRDAAPSTHPPIHPSTHTNTHIHRRTSVEHCVPRLACPVQIALKMSPKPHIVFVVRVVRIFCAVEHVEPFAEDMEDTLHGNGREWRLRRQKNMPCFANHVSCLWLVRLRFTRAPICTTNAQYISVVGDLGIPLLPTVKVGQWPF